MPNLSVSTTIEEYAKIAGGVLIRKLKSDFIIYVMSFLPAIFTGPLAPVVTFALGWIFDWIEKQAVFMAWCKYTDFRVSHQGTELGKAIYNEIQIKKGGNKDEILKAEKDTNKYFDDFVILSR